MKFNRPPLTNAEARQMAEDTIKNLHDTTQSLKRLRRVLGYIHPLVTLEQQEEMTRLLEEPLDDKQ